MLSRRTFLQLVGASLAATALQPATSLLAGVTDGFHQGRAFSALPVYRTQSVNSRPIAHFWPDSIVPIIDDTNDWYRIPNGWVRQEDVQPMLPYRVDDFTFIQQAPFWAEVAAPVAPVRAYCAADAPLVTRIGHGGVSQVIDALPGEPTGWYAIADQRGDLLGWTQGVFWRPVDVEDNQGTGNVLHFDRKVGLMSAYDNTSLILQARFSGGSELQAGVFNSQRGMVGSGVWQDKEQREGVPWQRLFGDGQSVVGVYWHNRFGGPVHEGPAVQLTPLLARWVYGWLGEQSHIVVD